MPRIPGTNNAQSAFLRSLLNHSPSLPPPELWPSPVILRRWLRVPSFRVALDAVRDALNYQTDLRLAFASDSAVQHLQSLYPQPNTSSQSAVQTQSPTTDAPDQPNPAATQHPSATGQSKIKNQKSEMTLSLQILKLSHTRQRFQPKPPAPPPFNPETIKADQVKILERMHPQTAIGTALEFIRAHSLSLTPADSPLTELSAHD